MDDKKVYAPRMCEIVTNHELRASNDLIDAYWRRYWGSRINPDTGKPYEYEAPERVYDDEL